MRTCVARSRRSASGRPSSTSRTGRRLTYAEFDAAVDEVARGLLARGVGRGDRVGIWAPNSIGWMLVQYATARIGAILVNINPAYRTHELKYVLGQAGISTLVSAVSFKTSQYRQMIDEVRPELPALSDVVYLDDPSWDALLADGAAVHVRPGGRPARGSCRSTTRSTSSTPRARRVSRRAPRSATTTSSTTATSSARG